MNMVAFSNVPFLALLHIILLFPQKINFVREFYFLICEESIYLFFLLMLVAKGWKKKMFGFEKKTYVMLSLAFLKILQHCTFYRT